VPNLTQQQCLRQSNKQYQGQDLLTLLLKNLKSSIQILNQGKDKIKVMLYILKTSQDKELSKVLFKTDEAGVSLNETIQNIIEHLISVVLLLCWFTMGSTCTVNIRPQQNCMHKFFSG